MLILKRSVKIFLCIICIFLLHSNEFFLSATAKIVENKKIFTLNVGKTIYLSHSKGAKFEAENTEIASVDEKGFVFAKNIGKSAVKIKNVDTNYETIVIINVINAEPIKFAMSSPNIVFGNYDVNLYAITHKNVQNVKFEIFDGSIKKTILASDKKIDGDAYVWSNCTKIYSEGKVNIVAYSMIQNEWQTCENGKFDAFLSSSEIGNDSTYGVKRVSDKCIDFIISCEGFRAKVYEDIAQNTTIGHGQCVYPNRPFYNNLTKFEAKALLVKQINNNFHCTHVNDFLTENDIFATQSQFDALVSFSYNLGTSWVFKSYLRNILLNFNNDNLIPLFCKVNSSNGLRLRLKPNLKSKVLAVMKHGEELKILDVQTQNTEWIFVEYKGLKGYCYKKFVEISQYINNPQNKRDLKSINALDFIKEFSAYCHIAKRRILGLLSRRFQELDMFFYGIYSKFKSEYYKTSKYYTMVS